MRIGILGGTFDPFHLGHLYLARKACAKFSLDKILFIPVYRPPHKKPIKLTPAKHRYNMLRLGIEGNRRFEVSRIEIRRKGTSYSVYTLRHLRKKYGSLAQIFFITGSDSLGLLGVWKNLKEILGLCKFVVVKRPNFAVEKASPKLIFLDIKAKDISSTDIRERLQRGLSVTHLVPRGVYNYIKKHKLYQKPKFNS